METIQLKFRLFAGVLLSDGKKFVSNANLTNENAVYFIKKDPENIKKFQKVPYNLHELLNPTPKKSKK